MKSLRTHLVLLVLGAVLPLLVFTVTMMLQQLAEKREIIDSGMQATARALTLAVDGEVKASLAILQTLASSPLLDSGNLKSFHDLCVRAMEGRRGAYVILFDASGNPLVNSSRPFGSSLPSPLQAAQPPGFDPAYAPLSHAMTALAAGALMAILIAVVTAIAFGRRVIRLVG